MKHVGRWMQVYCAVAIVFIVAACGGGSTSGQTGIKGPIHVGELFPMTGPNSFAGVWLQNGTNVGIYEINQHGGINGINLEPNLQDTSNDPVDAVGAYRAAQLGHPNFYVGPTAVVSDAVLPLFASAHNVDFVISGSPTYDRMSYPTIFRASTSDTDQSTAMALYAIHANLKHAVLFFLATANSSDEVPPLVSAYKAHGGQVLGTYLLSNTATSYRSELSQAFALHPDVAFFSMTPTNGAILWTDMRQLGLPNIPWVGDNAGGIDDAKAMGLQLASQLMTQTFQTSPAGPSYGELQADWQAVVHNNSVTPVSIVAYDSVIIAALAMLDANSSDPSVFIKSITKVTDEAGTECPTYASCVALLKNGTKIDYEGASGPMDFNQYHNVFGGFNELGFDTSGNFTTVYQMSAAQLAAFRG